MAHYSAPAAPLSTEAREAIARPDGLGVLDALPAGVLLLDTAGRIVRLNGRARRLLGSVPEPAGRDLFRSVLPELETQGWGARFRAGAQLGELSLDFEVAASTADDRPPLRLCVGAYSAGGHPGALAVLEDRSALAAERNRRERAERLAAVGELATGVAHEINNPLASIRGFAQLLAPEAVDDREVHGLEIINRETTRIARVVDGLLAFAGEQRTRGRGPLALSTLVDRLLDLRQYALETSGIEIRRDLDPDVSPVYGDRASLQRLMLALLGHAERSLASRSEGRVLIVRTRESTDGVVLSVIDNGAGIARSRLPRLLRDPADEDADGAIDLASASAIAREHGGHLAAESVDGQQTAFVLRLPRWTGETARAPDATPASRAASRPLRVLMAEEDSMQRLAVTLVLARSGHEVVQAADAEDALRLAAQQAFDVALVDEQMASGSLATHLANLPGLRGRIVRLARDASPPTPGQHLQPRLTRPLDMTEVIRLVEAIGR